MIFIVMGKILFIIKETMSLYKKNVRVLVIEASNQLAPQEKARPQGTLGPAYIIGSLRENGIETDYIDATVGQEGRDLNETFYRNEEMENGNFRYGMDPKEFPQLFSNYDIVATSSIFTYQTRMHFEIARMVKKASKESGKKILAISGGVNARSLREHFLSNGFDIVALGEGEKTIVQIVHQFSSEKPDYSQVERIAYRENGKTITTGAPPKKGTKFIEGIPNPAIDAFPLSTYQKLGIPHGGFLEPGTKYSELQTSRGCQDKCTYCHISLEKEERDLVGDIGFLKMFSNERVAEDVDRAVKLGVSRIYFEDDNLFFNKKRLFKLAPYLKREGLSYSNQNGANLRFLVKKNSVGAYETDDEFIEMLADFGLDEQMLPFETKSQEMMKKYATGKFDPDEMDPISILKSLKKHGIWTRSAFLIGFRDQSWESILETKEFAKELFNEGLDQAGFSIPVPFPGTKDFQYEMSKPDVYKDFNENLLYYTDRMNVRNKPLFQTEVPGEDLQAAVHDFWEELNESRYVEKSREHAVGK
ncbi:cobalamin-dependent protein [Candidatus Pelagibacter sp.]|nr:cobalamin-dependent protein [Candidatus Pelagibacter sp.]|tara:strand:+ start:442 stop:2034 length:1593 start_codon:yes stop_codon:yes gene_type:complete